MKIITAKHFASHASEIGKYLNKNPMDYYFVSNKTDPKKNFICCKLSFIAGRNSQNINEMALLSDRFRLERSLMSKKMSKTHWDNVKIARNDDDEKRLEKVCSNLYDDDSISSIADYNPSLKDMALQRGRRAGMVHKIYD